MEFLGPHFLQIPPRPAVLSPAVSLPKMPLGKYESILIALLTFLSFGFVSEAPETPEQKAERLKQEFAWRAVLTARFDLKYLKDFLASAIKTRRLYEGANR